MNRLLERQLRKFLGESYTEEQLYQSAEFQELISAIDQAYNHNDREKRLFERTIDLNSKELNTANTLLKKQNQEISELASVDALTGLPNRHIYKERIDQALQHAKRYDEKLAVMFIDLDRFKIINDSLGHHVGDLLLGEVAKRLTSCVRRSDTIARMGGDEFTILLEDLQSISDTTAVSKKILEKLSLPFELDGHELMVTASIGISIFPSDGIDLVSLVKHADTAMYHAKEFGRNNFQLYHPSMSIKALEYMAFESRLRKAIERKEFVLYYQPQMDIHNFSIIGMEALVRWHSPELGLLMPADFIPLAEETGLIIPIGEWILRSACMQNRIWQEAGLKKIKMAVNVSGRQLQNHNFISSIDSALEMSGLPPEYLDIELTESSVMKKGERAVNVMQQIKARGICLSIDDFGTGYSSLSILKRFTIDHLKVDRSFVHDIADDPDATTIIEAIIAMAKSLKLKVIAEGVETKFQLDFLKKLGCDHIQGYISSRPLTALEMEKLLMERQNSLNNRI